MKATTVLYSLMVAVLLPVNAFSQKNNDLPPQKRYVFDSTLRPRAYRYCSQLIGIPIKPKGAMSVNDLINLNNCVDQVIKNNEIPNNDDCRNCSRKVELYIH